MNIILEKELLDSYVELLFSSGISIRQQELSNYRAEEGSGFYTEDSLTMLRNYQNTIQSEIAVLNDLLLNLEHDIDKTQKNVILNLRTYSKKMKKDQRELLINSFQSAANGLFIHLVEENKYDAKTINQMTKEFKYFVNTLLKVELIIK